MYEVFINNKKLVFDSPAAEKKYNSSWEKVFAADEKFIRKEIFDLLTDENPGNGVVIFADEKEKIIKKFFRPFNLIDAAGGLVKNEKDQFLMIYRNQKWDLPKGKLEKNESPESGAMRETTEETGVSGLSVIRHLADSRHMYAWKEKMVLKKTCWYEMYTDDKRKLIPQISEGITEVKWMDRESVMDALNNSYALINELFKLYFEREEKKRKLR